MMSGLKINITKIARAKGRSTFFFEKKSLALPLLPYTGKAASTSPPPKKGEGGEGP